MSVYDDVLTAVIDLAEQTELYSKIVIGPMPPEMVFPLRGVPGT